MNESNSKKNLLNDSKNKSKEILIGDYIIKKTIGTGTFSIVKLGMHRITQKKVAIKILDKNKIESKDDLERILREMEILTEMDHQNVIKVFKIYEEKNNFSLIMEYCEDGELFNYIVKKQRLSEEEASYFFYQIINGIEYIHSKGIAHRDLKPENLLIGKNKILKIIDFGLSNYYNGQKRLETPCGSPCYASPEMVKGKTYDGFNIDIWAIGVILFAMLCGYLPFEDDENDNDVLFNQIIKNKINYPSFLSDLSLDILKKILVSEPLKRITIVEIKKHGFYLKGKKIFNEKFKEKEKDDNKKETNKILNKITKAFKSDDDFDKYIIKKDMEEKKFNNDNNNQRNKNILFLGYLDREKKTKKNKIQYKVPKIKLSKEESINYNYINNIEKDYTINLNKIINKNTMNNTEDNTLNINANNSKIINMKQNQINTILNNKKDNNKSNNIRNNNFLISGNITGNEGLLNTFAVNKKKKIFTKLEIKNHKYNRLGIQNIIPESDINKSNLKNKPFKLNLDIINNSKNSFDKQSHKFSEEFNNIRNNILRKKNKFNINNLKIINIKSNSKGKRKENSLENKLLKYNIKEFKEYNKLINHINVNANNTSKSVQKNNLTNITKPMLTKNNGINLNGILNNSINNNKNLESLQMVNTTNKIKNFPGTPSLLRYLPSKKANLPTITISDRIKSKIGAHKFNSINNTKYLSTEANYNKVEKSNKKILDIIGKKNEYLKLNYPTNFTISNKIS